MWKTAGQEHILHQLQASLHQDRVAHSYLITGPPQLGKTTLATDMAQAVNCTSLQQSGPPAPCRECNQCRRIQQELHPDIQTVSIQTNQEDRPNRTVIGIDDIRESTQQLHLRPYEGRCRVLIFQEAQRMSEEAANALLKTLEEPPPESLLLLLANEEEDLLPTIRSRCRTLRLRPVPGDTIARDLVEHHQLNPQEAADLARLSRGCPGWAFTMQQNPHLLQQRQEQIQQVRETSAANLETRFNHAADLARRHQASRAETRQALFLWLRWWRDILLACQQTPQHIENRHHLLHLTQQADHITTQEAANALRCITSTLEALDHNASPRLALEVMMLNLPTTKDT